MEITDFTTGDAEAPTSGMSELSATLPRTKWGLLPRSTSLSGLSSPSSTCGLPITLSACSVPSSSMEMK